MNIKLMYNELMVTSLIINFFDALLTAFSIFTLGYFIAYFCRLDAWVAAVAAGIFFIKSIFTKIRQNKILMLEKEYPNLKEKLRTSYDHKEKSNFVVNELHGEIVGVMQKIDISTFLSNNKLILKVFIIFLMLSSTLYFSSIGLDLNYIHAKVTNSQIFKKASQTVMDMFGEKRDEILNRETLDKGRLAKLGDEENNITIDTYNTQLNIKEITEPEKNDYGGHFPAEVSGAAEETYDSNIPEEHKEIIKEYFNRINK